jgi:serine/threonine protein phosphatase PrpC
MPISRSGHQRTVSERLYQVFLLAYPRAFRAEYESEMLQVFSDAYGDARHQRGTLGVLCLWRDFVTDLVKSACVQQVESWMLRHEHTLVLSGKERLAMALQLTLDVGQRTDTGQIRPTNEDQLISVVPEDPRLMQEKGGLFVVADGLGGHNRGDVASALTIQTVKDSYYQDLPGNIPESLERAIKQANTAIYRANETERANGAGACNMGTTCVAAVLHNLMLYVANVGDSRVYILRDGRLRQVTHDHSVVARLVERGEISPAEARTHEQRNVLYRALGELDVEVDLFTETVQDGDTLVLCTDGLWSVLEEDELRAIVEQYDPQESVQRLIAQANAVGGPDNVTAIVVRVSAP